MRWKKGLSEDYNASEDMIRSGGLSPETDRERLSGSQ